MILLDTNVFSALMLREPNRSVVAWLDEQSPESIWTTSVTLFEVAYGLTLLPKGRRRSGLEQAFAANVAEDLAGRVLAFDEEAAMHAADMAAKARRAGRPVEIRDMQIAGIVALRRATLATRNTKHFDGLGIRLVNPWKD